MSTIRHLSTAETARLLRAELKRCFPKTPFAVRSKTYRGGSSITVCWTDGPTVRQVDAVADRFQGANFDGMQDLKTARSPVLLDGERVAMGADFVFCSRAHSPAFAQQIADQVAAAGYGLAVVRESAGGTWWDGDDRAVTACRRLAGETIARGVEAPRHAPAPADPAEGDAPDVAVVVEGDAAYLRFGRKPRAAVRQVLRQRGYRWDGERAAWRAPGPLTWAEFDALGLDAAGMLVGTPMDFVSPGMAGLDRDGTFDPDGERDDGLTVWDDEGTPAQQAQRDAENAAAMLDFLQTTGHGPSVEAFSEAEVVRLDPVIVRLRRAADSAAGQAAQKRQSGIYRQTPTARRMRQLEGIEQDARRLEQTAVALRALADRREAGALPALLAPLTTRAMVERLILTGVFPSAQWDRPLWTAFIRAGITGETYPNVRAALLPLAEDAPAEPPVERQIRDALRGLVGLEIPDYFPTPPAVIDRLLAEADIREGMIVLEPSAGAGHLVDAIRERHPGVRIDAIEQHARLVSVLELKASMTTLRHGDFLSVEPAPVYDRIVANPPFSGLQDIAHVRQMYACLRPGGRLVSVMSESPFFRADRRCAEFRDWLESVGGWSEPLPAGSFARGERPTGVATRVVVIDKECP